MEASSASAAAKAAADGRGRGREVGAEGAPAAEDMVR